MAERPEPHRRPAPPPEEPELTELPPAVLCVVCGRADCTGHEAAPAREAAIRPPWEEPDAPWLGSAWATARTVTVDAARFFGALSNGSVGQALGFALLVELAAIGSLALAALGALGALLPDAFQVIARSPEDRVTLGLALGLGVPGMAAVMVALHLVWALGLEVGARRAGAPARPGGVTRYALYTCGWDLLTSPLGLLLALATGGPRRARADIVAALRVPRVATLAYLSGARGLDPAAQQRALRVAVITTTIVVVIGALGVIVGAVVLSL